MITLLTGDVRAVLPTLADGSVRVLRDDGTCWVNLGDSYAANGTSALNDGFNDRHGAFGHGGGVTPADAGRNKAAKRVPSGLKPKDLLLMPARVALALQADGWWLRSAIVWAKPNPMPESCKDRPVSSYEMVYLLTKRSRYYYDADAVAEPSLREGDYPGGKGGFINHMTGGHNKDGLAAHGARPVAATRSLRNVWTIATHAFPSAHFATFAPELAERCIRAGTSERGACVACGAPYVRITDKQFVPQGDVSLERGVKGAPGQKPMDASNHWDGVPRGTTSATTTGWTASCTCNADVRPCVVLDPFSGAGTALLVADRLGRDSIGIDLSHAYVEMARERLRADCPLFAEISDAPPAEDPEDERMADLFAEAAE